MFNNKLTTFALIILSSVFGSSVQAAPNNASCSTAQSIQSTLSSGAKWSMCWQARAEEGVVLSNIRYQANGQVERKVLGEISLSQIQRNYDDGSPTQYIVTDSGLGGDNLIALKENEMTPVMVRPFRRMALLELALSITTSGGWILI